MSPNRPNAVRGCRAHLPRVLNIKKISRGEFPRKGRRSTQSPRPSPLAKSSGGQAGGDLAPFTNRRGGEKEHRGGGGLPKPLRLLRPSDQNARPNLAARGKTSHPHSRQANNRTTLGVRWRGPAQNTTVPGECRVGGKKKIARNNIHRFKKARGGATRASAVFPVGKKPG